MDLNWLITGGCGFIGTSLLRRLAGESGHAVRIVDNLSVGDRTDLAEVIDEVTEIEAAAVTGAPTGVELVVADIRDRDAMRLAGQGIDVFVHLAANTGVGPSVEDPVMDGETNVMGTLACLESARANGIERFVFASSGAPLGEVTPPIHEELPAHPASPYGASKLAGEGYCSAYASCFGIHTVALRFGNVYGPGSKHKQSVVAKFIARAFAGETLEVYGDGGQTRDFIYIDDLVGAILKAATVDGIGGETFQIATSRETTVSELVDTLTGVLRNADVELPDVRHVDARTGDVRRNFSDTSKAKHRLDWQASVSLDEGLDRTVRYFTSVRPITH